MTNAVKAIIIKDGKLLLLKRNPALRNESNWDLPGGLIENGETETQALKREVKEEINVSIEILRKAGNWKFVRRQDNKIVQVQNFICHFTDNDTKIILSEEHISFEWIKPTDIVNYQVKDESLKKNILQNFK